MRRAAKRDANEREIIDALESAGAAVAQLSGEGIPDLLVSYRNDLTLLEVKDRGKPTRVAHRRNRDGTMSPALMPAQVVWWKRWNGKPPVIVCTPEEALAAIGVTR